MLNTIENTRRIWRLPALLWVALGVMAAIVTGVFFDGLELMVKWWERDEYSHGYLIPVIVIFLIWQKKDILEQVRFTGSWFGVLVVLLGVLLYFVGEFSTLYTIIQYAFLLTIFGLALAFLGWETFKVIWVPLVILAFMIPLPNFIYFNLSSELQLISSQIGVAFIRMFGISVYLEGNVIDLGSYKLQVVEACSGLRYLFPLMTLGFIAAYFFKGTFWKRAVIFLSSIPITILMNSFRIGAIGVMVEYWGPSMAEGFLHDFEGWAVFMACTGVLILEMWLLAKIGRPRKPLREAFGLEFPEHTPADANVERRRIPVQLFFAAAILVVALVVSAQVEERVEIIPDRNAFAGFPSRIGNWEGKSDRLEQIYIDALKLDDYIVAKYSDGEDVPVEFYAAYYGSQSKGESAHSPRACLPGGGWRIKAFTQEQLDGASVNGLPLTVNRALIQKGDVSSLVYYWFQQRGRVITNEYLVKWFLFWDALTRNRTDGALVRLTMFVPPGQNIEDADRRMTAFTKELAGILDPYIPN